MPCYGRGATGDALRDVRRVVRWHRLHAGGVRDFRCAVCRRRSRVFRLIGPPEECPNGGRETAEWWHEEEEG